MYIYAVINSLTKDEYRKVSSYCGGLDPSDDQGLTARSGGFS
jgi:hypothetical protein